MYKIEKNIELPVKKFGAGSRYPFEKMEIGDSFLCNEGEKQIRLTSSTARAGKKLGMKFTTRVVEENRVRVWRIK